MFKPIYSNTVDSISKPYLFSSHSITGNVISKPYLFKPFNHCNHRRFHQHLPLAVPRNQRLQPSPRPKLRSRSCSIAHRIRERRLRQQSLHGLCGWTGSQSWRNHINLISLNGSEGTELQLNWRKSDWKLIGNWLESDGSDDPSFAWNMEWAVITTSEHCS